jgi:hypothetical protein
MGCDNGGPPTGTIILAIPAICELWCSLPQVCAKGSKANPRFVLAADLRFRAQNTSPFLEGSDGGAGSIAGTAVTWLAGHLVG